MRFVLFFGMFCLLACSKTVGGAVPTVEGKQPITVTVTDAGFEPQDFRVVEGVPVQLAITRKAEHTCATEIVIDEYGIKHDLPLNKTVVVEFTPTKTGELRYGCAMGKMVGGVISVQSRSP